MFSSLNSKRSELSSSVVVTDSSELEKTIDFFAFFYVFRLFAFFWSCLVLGFLCLYFQPVHVFLMVSFPNELNLRQEAKRGKAFGTGRISDEET